jgi:hypothetical protein
VKPKILKTLPLVVLITFALSFSVAAKEDPHRAAVEELLILTKQDRLIEQMYPHIKQMAMFQMGQADLPKEQSLLIEKYLDKLFAAMKREMSWDKIKDEFIQLYMSVYTEKEIHDLIAFYRSSTGQKMIDKMPLLMEQSSAITQKHTLEMMPKIQEIIQEMVTEIGKLTEEQNPSQ